MPREARRSTGARAGITLLLSASLASASCRDATQVRLAARTNVEYRAGVNFALWASSRGDSTNPPLSTGADPWLQDGSLGDLVITPREHNDEPLWVRVAMGVGRDASTCSDADPRGCIVAKRKLSFVPHTSLRLPVVLHLACAGVVCLADTTCNYLGKCTSAEVDPVACAEAQGCGLPGDETVTGTVPLAPVDAGPAETGQQQDAADASEVGLRITLTSAASVTLTDYQVRVEIPKRTGMRTDYGDVRFKDPQGAQLSYWLEEYNDSRAVFWLKVPAIAPKTDTFLLATYGDASLLSASNGRAVFPIFDDFSASSFDAGYWSQMLGNGTLTQSGGALKLACASTSGVANCDWYFGTNTVPKIWRPEPPGDYAMHARWTTSLTTDGSNRMGLFVSSDPTGPTGTSVMMGDNGVHAGGSNDSFLYGTLGAETGAPRDVAVPATYFARIRKTGPAYFGDYSADGVDWKGNYPVGSPAPGFAGLMVKNYFCCAGEGLVSQDYDYVFARKYESAGDPKVTVAPQ